jgi:hypothetical protein
MQRARFPVSGSIALALATVLLVFTSSTAWAKPEYLGLWVVQQAPNLTVSFPAADELGSTVRVVPTGEANVTAVTRAEIPFFENGFEKVRMHVLYELDPTKVHARITIDGKPAELLDGTGPQDRVLELAMAGSTLGVEIQTTDAAPTGWSVQVQGVGFDRNGWTFWYSPDCAGLAGWAEADDRLRLGVDPDWGELEWPLTGSLTVARKPQGGVDSLAFTYAQQLPGAGLVVRASLDGLPLELFASGLLEPAAFTWPEAKGQQVEFTLRAYDAVAANPTWQAVVADLRADPNALPPSPDSFSWEFQLPGDATATGATAPPPTSAGCTVSATVPTPNSVLVLLFAACAVLAAARRRHRDSSEGGSL